MNQIGHDGPYEAPRGTLEPHAPLLKRPTDDQLLFKVMTVENLLSSIDHRYLHFNLVSRYSDFSSADLHDGEQLPLDRDGNHRSRFERAPAFSAADYYDKCRSRTYACSFSLENSRDLWESYGTGGSRGKACLVARFGVLRARINRTMERSSTRLVVGDTLCHQIFDINYGLVEYVDWHRHQANAVLLPNPITYPYLKDKNYCREQELRVSLSAPGIGQFLLTEGVLTFPQSLQLSFDLRTALSDGTFEPLLLSPDCDVTFLRSKMEKFGIEVVW